MRELWLKSSSSQTKKRQQTLEEFFGLKSKKKKKEEEAKKTQQTNEHFKTQQKPTDWNRMVTVHTFKKSWKNAVLPKYAANYWLTYDRIGQHPTNWQCLLCCHYVKHIDNWKVLKVNELKAVLLMNKWRNVSQQWLNFIKVFKKIYKSLCPIGFHKCPTEFYFLQTYCSPGFEKLFAALILPD